MCNLWHAGAPVSGVPGRLRAVICRGMEQVQAVLVEAQHAQQACPGRQLNVLGGLLSLFYIVAALRHLWQVKLSACIEWCRECFAIPSKGAARQNAGYHDGVVQAQWQPH